MATKTESWQAKDGTLHRNEIEAVRHETTAALAKSFPELKTVVSTDRIYTLCLMLLPLSRLVENRLAGDVADGDHPPEADTTPDCDCPARGTRNPHHLDCYSVIGPRAGEVTEIFIDGNPVPVGHIQRSNKPRINACSGKLPAAHCNDPDSYDITKCVRDSDAPLAPAGWIYCYSFIGRPFNKILDVYSPSIQLQTIIQIERDSREWAPGMVSPVAVARFYPDADPEVGCAHAWERGPLDLIDICIHCKAERA